MSAAGKAVQATLTRERVASDLQTLGDLPSLSPVVAQLTATLNRPDVEVLTVETIILRDPVIAAKVVSAANAAAYASRTPTTTVRAALIRLGLLRVRRLALLISLYNAVPRVQALQDAFWRHCLAVAHATQVIMRHAGSLPPAANADTAFMGGLLHDLGILVLASHYPKHYAVVSAVAGETGAPLWEVEQDVLHIDHGEIGACLAESWAFPPDIVAPIRFHHRLAAAPAEHCWSAAVVRLADLICGTEPEWDLGEGCTLADGEPALAALGLAGDIGALVDQARAEASRATSVLESVG